MSILSDLFLQQQAQSYIPQASAKTPQQMAYDNVLQAQQQAQQQAKNDEWNAAIGNSVNGLGKIISSAVISNPYERAGAVSNLDNFDERQDRLIREWAANRAGQRNDFVQQAKEQLALANADADKQYAREQDEAKFAYQKLMDELKQQNFDRQFDFNSQQSVIDNALKQAQKNKINAETDAIINANSPEAIEAKEKELKDKELKEARKEQLKTYVATARDLFNKGKIDNKTLMAIENNPPLAETLIPANTLFWKSSSKMKLGDKDSLGYEIMVDKDGNTARVYKDGRIEEIR